MTVTMTRSCRELLGALSVEVRSHQGERRAEAAAAGLPKSLADGELLSSDDPEAA
jgi:hypothetical protein